MRLEDFRGRFAEVAVFEMDVMEGRLWQSTDGGHGVAEDRPAELQHLVLCRRKGTPGEPGRGDGDGFGCQSPQKLGEDAHLLQLPRVGSDS